MKPAEGQPLVSLKYSAKTGSSDLPGGIPEAVEGAERSLVLIDPKPFTRRLIGDMLTKIFPEYFNITAGTVEEFLAMDLCSAKLVMIIIYIRSSTFYDLLLKDPLKLFKNEVSEEVPVVLLSDRIEISELSEALGHGVRGYIPTSAGYDVAMAALKLIDAGGTYIPADALRDVSTSLHPDRQEDMRNELDLTPREHSVFRLLREGNPNKIIATQLQMQESTVKVHVRNILKKLHATNRTHAVSLAGRLVGEKMG